MVIFLLIYIAVCLYGMKICAGDKKVPTSLKKITVSGQSWNDYMSKEKTRAIKGIFVIMVFISHFSACFTGNAGDVFVHNLITQRINQLMVTMFMFYSGYGIMESVKKKGRAYVKNMPVQRILKLLFDFDIAILLYLVLNTAIGKYDKPTTIVSAFFAWDSIGNSDWYIFAILCLYIFSFVAFFLSKKNHYAAAAIVTVLCGAYCIVMKKVKDDWWFNTVICYAFGMWFSLLRDKFEKIVQRSCMTWAVGLILSVTVFAVSFILKRKFIMYEICCLSFVLCILLFTMKVSVDNRILRKFGDLVFGVYILQKIPMIVFNKFGLIEKNPYLSFIACLAITFALAVGFNYFTKLTAKLFNKFRIKECA